MSVFVRVGKHACMHVYVSVAPTLAMCQKLLIEIDLDVNCIVPEEEFVFTASLTQNLAKWEHVS